MQPLCRRSGPGGNLRAAENVVPKREPVKETTPRNDAEGGAAWVVSEARSWRGMLPKTVPARDAQVPV